MVHRLVLGCGAIGHAVVERMGAWSGDLSVIEPDGDRVETLRAANVAADHADPTDREVLESVEGAVETVLVAGDDPEVNRAVTVAARRTFPDALLVAYAGETPSADLRESMAAVADRVIDHGPTVATWLLDRTEGDAGERFRKLTATLKGVEGRLGVFMHDNPDPDAIGSAIALRELARLVGTDADACYFGEITHQENRALVNLLDLTLTRLEPEEFDPEAYAGIALVDHSRPGVNDQLPEDTTVDVVIDHHPPREAVSARFIDLRSEVGATSTLLTDHYRRFGVSPDVTVATALLYGIRVDTRDFGREITRADFEAAAHLLPAADVDVLERVESPSVSGDTVDTVARAIRNRTREGPTLVSGVGGINQRDALAQAADRLLTMEGVTTTVVYGFADGTVFVSARARGTDLDVGEAIREAFGQIGSAGGHTDMAGAQIPLGILGDVTDEEEASLEDVVSEVIEGRFFEVVGPNRPRTDRGVPFDPMEDDEGDR